MLPLELVRHLPIGRDHGQLTIRTFMLHQARLDALQQASTRATRPQRFFNGAGLEHVIHCLVRDELLQRADRGENHEKLLGLVPLNGILRAHPLGRELLFFISFGALPNWHACHQEGHLKSLGHIAIGQPMGQQKHLIGGERVAMSLHLRIEIAAAIQRINLGLGDPCLLRRLGRIFGQCDAEFFKTFPNRSQRPGDVLCSLRAA